MICIFIFTIGLLVSAQIHAGTQAAYKKPKNLIQKVFAGKNSNKQAYEAEKAKKLTRQVLALVQLNPTLMHSYDKISRNELWTLLVRLHFIPELAENEAFQMNLWNALGNPEMLTIEKVDILIRTSLNITPGLKQNQTRTYYVPLWPKKPLFDISAMSSSYHLKAEMPKESTINIKKTPIQKTRLFPNRKARTFWVALDSLLAKKHIILTKKQWASLTKHLKERSILQKNHTQKTLRNMRREYFSSKRHEELCSIMCTLEVIEEDQDLCIRNMRYNPKENRIEIKARNIRTEQSYQQIGPTLIFFINRKKGLYNTHSDRKVKGLGNLILTNTNTNTLTKYTLTRFITCQGKGYYRTYSYERNINGYTCYYYMDNTGHKHIVKRHAFIDAMNKASMLSYQRRYMVHTPRLTFDDDLSSTLIDNALSFIFGILLTTAGLIASKHIFDKDHGNATAIN